MTPSHPFQRARKPEEINQRRKTILAAAAELFDAHGPSGAGLNAIAAKAGFTKSNVYRYFESREQVLLELFQIEFVALADALELALPTVPENDIAQLAETITGAFLARPRCCELISILSSTLEQNVSEDTIASVKTHMFEHNARAVAALAPKLPNATLADCAWVIAMIGSLLSGMWAGAHPPPAAKAVLARPDFAHLRMDVARDLKRAAEALLVSIVH